MEHYNITDPTSDRAARWFTAEELRESVKDQPPRYFLDVSSYNRAEVIACRVAACSRGWVTAVSSRGGIFQAWAGNFFYTDSEKEALEAAARRTQDRRAALLGGALA